MATGGSMLAIPFRRTYSFNISEALKDVITTKFSQPSGVYSEDLEAINQIHNAAIRATEPRISNIHKMQLYAAQLANLMEKMPVDIGADIIWFPALGYNTKNPTTLRTLQFEYASVLFNLAALYSQIGVTTNRTTSDGLRDASNYFCLAAGVISFMKTNIAPYFNVPVPGDFQGITLECLESILLAQAQECFWQKAVKDGLKDSSIARLAAKVSDFYAEAKDYGVKSDSITSEWIHHTTAKHHHFAAAAYFRAACDCLEKRKYGEQVAYLRESASCVDEAKHEIRYLNKVVAGDLNGLNNRVQEDLKRAEKDNDLIYLESVPPKAKLKALDRASMVASKTTRELVEPLEVLNERNDFGQPLFKDLIPYTVQVAIDNYAERKDRLIRTSIIDELERLNVELQDVLKSLNLPGAILSLEKPLGLSTQVLSHAEEIREQGGIDRIYELVRDTTNLKENDKNLFDDGASMLQAEAAEDDEARRRYGTIHWTRQPSDEVSGKLLTQQAEIEGYLKSAEHSDQLVKVKLSDNEKAITLLSGLDSDLEAFVPSNMKTAISSRTEQEMKAVRNCLNRVTLVASRRNREIDEVRAVSQDDDIKDDILKEVNQLRRKTPSLKLKASQFEDMFERRLKRYDEGKNIVRQEKEAQMELISQLRESHAAFTQAKRGEPTSRRRDDALQSLESGYLKYNEIISNLDVGRKFYKDLTKIVTRFRDECKSFAESRHSQHDQMDRLLNSMMSNLSMQPDAKPRQDVQSRVSVDPNSARKVSLGPKAVPKDASVSDVPTISTWTPEMGIKFAGSAVGTEPSVADIKNTRDISQDTKWNPSKGMRFS